MIVLNMFPLFGTGGIVHYRYERLRSRHGLEMEGYHNEATMLRKRLVHIEKHYALRQRHMLKSSRSTPTKSSPSKSDVFLYPAPPTNGNDRGRGTTRSHSLETSPSSISQGADFPEEKAKIRKPSQIQMRF
jgi:hypothetical protein